MSISLGFCVPVKAANNTPSGCECIRLPHLQAAAGRVKYSGDAGAAIDDIGRAALETMRDSYHHMPTGSVREFAAVFSRCNYDFLAAEVKRRSGYDIDMGDLFDAMIYAFTMVAPRTDKMDVERRLDFSPAATRSYVAEINRLVLERTVEEVKQANKLWDFYATNRNGPSEVIESAGVDTRTRLVSSFYAADYWMPE